MRRISVFILSLLLLLSVTSTVFARPDLLKHITFPTLRFEHLSIEDGLSQNAVLAILQDHNGFMWLGTQDGLNRYDGYTFNTLRHDNGNPNSLSNSSVLSLEEDRDGILWIGTWGGGLNKYDPAVGTFTAFKHDAQDQSTISDDTVTDILIARDGSFWLATMGGLDRFDPLSGKFTHFRSSPLDSKTISADNISVLYEDSHGILWIGTGFGVDGNGLNAYDPATGSFTRYRHNPMDAKTLSGNNVSAIFEDREGRLWVGTGGFSLIGSGINLFDPATNSFTHYQNNPANLKSLSNDNVMSIWQDENGFLWIATWEGINLFDPNLGVDVFESVVNDPNDPTSLSANILWTIFQDRSGVVWLGTLNGGVSKFNPRHSQFELYRSNPSDAESLGFNVVSSFYEDKKGNFWVGTWGTGLDKFDRVTGKFSHFPPDASNPASVPSTHIMSFYEDSQGVFWVGTMNGLAKFNSDGGTFTTYHHNAADPDSMIHDSVNTILEDKSGRLWISTMGGLDRYDRKTGKFIHYQNNPEVSSTLSDNRAVLLYIDHEDNLWVGTWGGGLNRYDVERDSFISYKNDPADPNSLSDNSVWTMLQDAKDRIWVGTQGGLALMTEDSTFKRYGLKDGLSSEVIMGILEDDLGNLWLSTGNGLVRFNPDTETFKIFDVNDGLQSNEFNSGAYYKDSAGKIYFGGIRGFNVFDPEKIRDNSTAPQIAITSFRVFNELMSVDLSGRTKLKIPYWQNFIAFEFAALDYHSSEKNLYAYKLDGFDEEWVDAGTRRYASYTNLPGGDYTFRVKAANSDGVWNEEGIFIPITITPPFWGTWWFQGGIALLVIGLLVAGYTIRVRGIQEQKNVLEKEVAQRTEELRLAQKELAKHAEEELSVSEARFRAVFDTSAVGIGIMGLDRKIIEANPAMCKMLGRTAEELVGQTPALATYPEDYTQSTLDFQDLLAGKLDHYWSERRYVRSTGEVFWASVTMSLVRDLNGAARYLVGMVIDIDEQKRMLTELKESEARFRTLHDYAEMGIAITNFKDLPTGMALDDAVFDQLIASQRINPAMMRMFGYTAEEIERLNITATDMIYPEDHNMDADLFRELFAGKRDSYKIEKRYVRKDGSVFWGRLNYSLVRAADGVTPLMAIGIIEDVNEEKHAQERLRESEVRFRAMFENAAIGMSLVGLDRRILEVNSALVKMSGFSREEMLKMSGPDIVYSEDRAIGAEEYMEMLDGKRESSQMERRYVRKDGNPYWVRLTVSAVRASDGMPLYLVAMSEDIDQQKRSQEELRQSEARFRAMFDNTSVGIALTTLDRQIIQVNQAAARITGYTVEEFKNINPVDLAVPEDRLIGQEELLELITGKRDGFSVEKRYMRKDGSIFWGRVTYTIIKDNDCCPEYMIGLIEDITEQKLSREKLENQERAYLLQLEKRVEERTQELSGTNLRLHMEIEQRKRAEEALAIKAAEDAVVAERNRLARDLHDAVTQTLFSASLIAEVLPDLWKMDENEALRSTEELRQLTRGSLAEMRTLLLELRPAALTQASLGDLLKQLSEAIIGRARLPIALTVDGERKLPPEIQIAFYRIAQESLNNVVKYARASQVTMHLMLSVAGARLEIVDNGSGFDMSRVRPTSLGLRIMRERAEAIGAEWTISSSIGEGTCVTVMWNENQDDKE